MIESSEIRSRADRLELEPPRSLPLAKARVILATLLTAITFPFEYVVSRSRRYSFGFSWAMFVAMQRAVWSMFPKIGTIDFRNVADAFGAVPKDVDRVVDEIGGVRVERFGGGGVPGPLLLYFHGGGYVIGSSFTSAPLIEGLVEASGVPVLYVDYRLAPEHPWPAALDDAFRVYGELVATRRDPAEIVLVGDSAGGNLCMQLLHKLKSERLPMPGGAVLICPWTDLSNTGESFERNARHDYITLEAVRIASAALLRDHDPKDPAVSPLFADLSGLPPILVQAGELEVLVDQIRAFIDKAKIDGAQVISTVYEDMIHDWHIFPIGNANRERAFEEIRRFVESTLNGPRPAPRG